MFTKKLEKPMFDLYKKRDFSAYFSDTITFFKSFGKHYFKNYFTINGIFLMILVVLIYFITKIYMETLFSLSSNPNPNFNHFSNYFNNNMVLIIGTILFFVLLTLFLSLLNITYPIVYIQLVEKNGGNNFGITEIIIGIKENIGRLMVFFIGTLFVITPILLIFGGILILLCFVIIGIPLFLLFIPSVMSWISLSYFEYLTKKVSFFNSLKNGIKLLKQDFWTTIGTTFLMSMLIQIIQGFITMIPYIIGVIWIFVSAKNLDTNSQNDSMSAMSILMAVIMVFSVLLSYIFNNFLLINQGLIFYSLCEENENKSSKSQIDLIGIQSE